MFYAKTKRLPLMILVTTLLLLTVVTPAAAALNDLFSTKEPDEKERKETLQKIDSIQEKLKLLQDKLRALERRKAAKDSTQGSQDGEGATLISPPGNWQPINELTTDPGQYGLYTYLLFKGDLSDTAAVGVLEDFILTIETLPENDVPSTLANRFLVPVEKPQSTVNLGRQPYDFRLNEQYLRRLELHNNLPSGPILVSTREPIDPYGNDEVPAFIAVSFGRQSPQKALELAKVWHRQEKDPASGATPVSGLFWEIIDGAGPTVVAHYQQRILVALPQQ